MDRDFSQVLRAVEIGLSHGTMPVFVLDDWVYMAVARNANVYDAFVCVRFDEDDEPYGLAEVHFGQGGDDYNLSPFGIGDYRHVVGGRTLDCTMIAKLTAGTYRQARDEIPGDTETRVQAVVGFAQITIQVAQAVGVFPGPAGFRELMEWGASVHFSERRAGADPEALTSQKEMARLRRACAISDPPSVSEYGQYVIGPKAIELLGGLHAL